jgi:predicted nucleic acid-binding protein
MDAYYDTGVLVPLYIVEAFSESITALLEQRDEAVFFNSFHHLEMENALRLKVFRGEITGERCLGALRKIRSDVECGMLSIRPVNWVGALDTARRIGERVTCKTGCRSLDLLHVAIAVQWECGVFVTADDRQLAAAKSEGLATVDLRHPQSRGGLGPSGPWTVKERRGRYRAGKRNPAAAGK